MNEAAKGALTLDRIVRRFKQVASPLEVLKGASLTLMPGECVALVGPSGAGKSTLLHIAGLLEHADDGEVFLAGKPCSKMSEVERTEMRRKYLGFVYQFHHLLPEFSALENVVIPQMIAGMTRKQARERAHQAVVAGRVDGARDAPAGAALRRRAATRRHRARGRQCAQGAVGGRAHRQSRPAHGRVGVRRASSSWCAAPDWRRWSRHTILSWPPEWTGLSCFATVSSWMCRRAARDLLDARAMRGTLFRHVSR